MGGDEDVAALRLPAVLGDPLVHDVLVTEAEQLAQSLLLQLDGMSLLISTLQYVLYTSVSLPSIEPMSLTIQIVDLPGCAGR